MAPSTEYHKRSHSRSEVLRFSCTFKNAGSVYYRRYTLRTTALLKMTGSFCSRSQHRLSCIHTTLNKLVMVTELFSNRH